MGSMTVLGAIEDGLGQTPKLLITKSVLDGFAAFALASAYGAGVAFSVVPLLLFQGSITILARYLGNTIDPAVVNEMTAVGGLMLIGLGITMLDIKKLKILNLLPALVMAIPARVEPVKDIIWISGWVDIAGPTTRPSPWTRLKTPAG